MGDSMTGNMTGNSTAILDTELVFQQMMAKMMSPPLELYIPRKLSTEAGKIHNHMMNFYSELCVILLFYNIATLSKF